LPVGLGRDDHPGSFAPIVILSSVIPAKAGIHLSTSRYPTMDAGFRRHDDKEGS
jgi:hypothetical protein